MRISMSQLPFDPFAVGTKSAYLAIKISDVDVARISSLIYVPTDRMTKSRVEPPVRISVPLRDCR